MKQSRLLSVFTTLLLSVGLLSFIPAVQAEAAGTCAGATCSQTFSYTGAAQTFVPPSANTMLTFTVNGGAGGRGGFDATSPGGNGASGSRVTFTYLASSLSPLYLYIGSAGGGGASGANGGGGAAGANPWTIYNGGRGGNAGYQGTSGAGGAGGAATVVSTGDKTGVIGIAAGGAGGGGANVSHAGSAGVAELVNDNAATMSTGTNGAQGGDLNGDGGGGGGGGAGVLGGRGGVPVNDGAGSPAGGYSGRSSVSAPATIVGTKTVSANAGNGSITISWPNGPSPITSPSFTATDTAKVGQVLTPADGTFTSINGAVSISNRRWQISTDGITFTDITPTVTGNYTIQPGDAGKYVRFAEDAADSVSTLTFGSSASLQITGVPVFTAENPTGSSAAGIVNTALGSYTFAASGYRNVYSISEGTLPAGITLNASTGVLSGTATVTGEYKYKVKVTNEAGTDETAELTLIIGRAPVFTSDDSVLQSVNRVSNPFRVAATISNFVFTTASFPAATLELKTDSVTIPTCGTYPNCAYSFETLGLPEGLTFDPASGTLSGTPTKTGAYVFAIKATNAVGSAVEIVHMSVAAKAPQALALSSDKNAVTIVQNTTVTAVITATGGEGNGAYSFSVDPASSAICSVAKTTANTATMTVIAAGNCVIIGTKAADGGFATSRTSITIPVNKAAQTAPLVVTADTDPLVVGGNATWIRGTGGNGTGAYTWALDPSSVGVCVVGTSISGNNMYMGYLTAGTCTYIATKAGDAFFLPQTTKFSIVINKAAQAALSIVNNGASNWNAGTPPTYNLSTSGGSGTGAVTYTIDSASAPFCSLNGTVLTAKSAGTCNITAYKSGDVSYLPTTSAVLTWTINVINQPALTISMTTPSGTVIPWNGGTTYVANPSTLIVMNITGGAGTGAYTYTATGNSGCVVQGAGSIAYVYAAATGTGTGSCFIAVSKLGDVNYNVATANTQFSFSTAAQTPLNARPAQSSIDFIATTVAQPSTGAQTQITVTGGSGTGAVTYAVANTSTSVCSVDATGLVTNKTAGTCLVNVTKAADTNYLVATTSTTITFNKLNQAELVSVPADESEPFVWSPKATNQITTTGGAGTGAISYAVDPSSSTVCSVNASTGLITDITAGTCVINVTRAADTNYNVATDKVTVVFTKIDPAAITLTAAPSTLVYTTAVNKNQTWVTVAGGANSTGATTFFVDPLTEENCSIATVQANRVLVNANLAGLCLISAVQAADVNYNEVRTFIGFTITKMVQTIGATSSTGTSPYFFVAPDAISTINVTGQAGTGITRFVVDPANSTSNCVVDQATAKVTAPNVGTCRITVSRDGDDNVQASNSVVLNLTILKINQAAMTIAPVDGFKLAAVGSAAATSPLTLGLAYTGTGNFTRIVSTTPLVCTISGGGDSTLPTPTFTATANPSLVVTAVDDGTCTLQYSKLGDANFNVATNATASFTIGKATQAELTASITAGSASMPFVATPKATANITGAGGSGTGVLNYTVDPTSSAVCSVNLTTGVVTDITAGTCLINVKRLTDTNFAESAVKQITITFTKIDQAAFTLTAAKSALRATTSALDTTTITAAGGSGTGVVAYSIAADSLTVCSLSGTSVTGLTPGDCNLVATKAADVNYNIATATVRVTVTKGNQAALVVTPYWSTIGYVPPTPADASLVNAFVWSGGTGSGDLVFTIDPSSAQVCNRAGMRPGVPSHIQVFAVGSGTCTISVYKSGGTAWENSNTVVSSFTITKIAQAGLTATASKSTLTYFDAPANTFTVAVTGGSGDGATSISINPSSAAICSDATVSGGVITVKTIGIGTCLLSAVKAASAGYTQVTSAQISVTITKGTQAPIVMSALPSPFTYQAFPRATSTLSVTGGSGNGALTISVDTGSTAICSYNDTTKLITALQAGRCDLTATKAAGADGLFNAATGKLSVTINKIAQTPLTLTPVSPYLQFSESPKSTTVLNLGGGTGTGAVTYSVEPGSSSVCSVSVVNQVATVTANYFGYCVVTATKAGDVNYADATTSATVRIAQPGTDIIATAVSNEVPFVPAPRIANTINVEGSKDGDILSYSVDASSRSICSVSGNGTTASVTAFAQGVCNVIAINVSRAPDGTLIASSSVATFTITRSNQTDVTLTASPASVYFAVPAATSVITVSGGVPNSAITATVDPSSAANCSVTVSGNKITMTALQVGECLINVNKAGNAGFAPYDTSFTVTILKTKQADLVLKATPSALTYSASNVVTTTLSTTGGSGTGDVSYEVAGASASICSIDGNIVSVITGGDCVVIATKAGDVNFADATDDLTITIAKGTQSALVVTAGDQSLQYVLGETVQTDLNVTGGSGDGDITYSIAEESAAICELDGNNVVVLKAGTCKVNATKASDPYFNSATSSVTIIIAKGVQAALLLDTVDESMKYHISEVVRTGLLPTGGSGTGAISYTVDASSLLVCALQNSNIVALRAGFCTINATKAGDSDFLATTASVTIEITKADQLPLVLASEDATLAYVTGVAVKTRLSVTGGSGLGAVSYAVASGSSTVCSVTGNVVTALTSGDCVLVATKATDANHLEATDTLTVRITKGIQAALKVTAANATLVYSSTNAATTTVSATGGSGTGAITYAVADDSAEICSIAGNVVTVITGGDCVIIATKAGDVTYEPAEGSVTIKIQKGNQTPLVLTAANQSLQFNKDLVVKTELDVTGGSGDGLLEYTVSPSSSAICEIDGDFAVALRAGTCVITVTKEADPYFNEATANVTITFTKAAQDALVARVAPGQIASPKWNGTKTTQVIITGGDGYGALTLVGLTPTICSVELAGQRVNVTAITAGNCEFRMNKDGDYNFLPASALTQSVVIGSDATDLSVSVAPTGLLVAGTTGTIQITVTNIGDAASAGATVDYVLPTGFSAVAPIAAGCVLVSSSEVRCTSTAVIPADGTVSFAVRVSILASLVGGELSEGGSVELTSPTPDSSLDNNSLSEEDANFTINKAPSAFNKTTLDAMQTGTEFEDQIEAEGFPAVTYSVTAGTLPAGLTLNTTTGEISGTPTGVGAYSFTVTASNSAGSFSKAFSGSIAPKPVVTTPAFGFSTNTVPAGTRVTIIGTNLDLVTSAIIGGRTANIASKTSTQITLDVPNASAAGYAAVSLVYAGGILEAGVFTYTGAERLNPVIVVDAGSATATAADTARTLTASITATGVSGFVTLPVTYVSRTTAICTVTGNQLTFVGVGLCKVAATSAVTPAFNAGTSADVSITVSKGSQTLTIVLPKDTVPPTKATDSADGFELTASASSGLPVVFVSTTPAICDVTEGGFVTGIKPGTCIVNVSQAGDSKFNPIPATKMEFTITKDPGGPSIDNGDPSKPTSLVGGALTKMGDVGFSWDKNAGALKVETYGIWIGKISAVSEFKISGKAYKCTVNFGTLKAMPSKTAAQLKAAMAKKTFKATAPFCNVKTEAAAFTALKKGFNGLQVKVTISRFRMYPTTYKPINAKTKKPITTQIRTVYLTLG